MKKTASIILLLAALRATAQPTISSVSPLNGNPGSTVTITGAGFNTTPANDVVYFGATRASVTSASATSLSVTVPVGATYDYVTVNNTATLLTGYSHYPFLPTYDNSPFVPGITNFDGDVSFPDPAGYLHLLPVAADLDGDGRADVVALTDKGFTVYRNTSSAGSITSSSFATGVDTVLYSSGGIAGSDWATDIATGDIDGDGKPDIVVAFYNGAAAGMNVYRNTSSVGSISFAAPVFFAATGDVSISALTIQDVNGDGKADIIGGGPNIVLQVFLNTGTPGTIDASTMSAPVNYSIPFGPGAYTTNNVTIGDVDGDDRPDVVLTDGGQIWVLRNNLTGFDDPVSFNAGIDIHQVLVYDIDGDGKPDLISANTNENNISVLKNTSTTGIIDAGSFASPVTFTTGLDAFSMTVADFTGDGKPDIAVFNVLDQTVTILRNSATPGVINSSSLTQNGSYPTNNNSLRIASGDIDGDGKADIITAAMGGGIGYAGIAVLRNAPLYPPPTITSISPASGHVGSTVTITGTNFNTTAANNIVYFGATRATVSSGTSTSLNVIVPVDATFSPVTLNNDTAIMAYSNQFFLPTYDNSPYIPNTVNFDPKVAFATGNLPNAAALGDLDGDGKTDIAVVNLLDNTMSVYLNTSTTGSISASSFAVPLTLATGAGPYSVAIGDIDGDGKPDIAVGNAGNNVSVHRNTSSTGSISFSSPVSMLTGFGPQNVAISDVDGDGKPDLVVVNFPDSTISILRNLSAPGNIAFNPQVVIATGHLVTNIAIGDMNGDNKPDIVEVLAYSNHISILQNTATMGSITTSSFAAPVIFVAGNHPVTAALGDVDGDGKLDIAVNNTDDNSVSVFRNLSTGGAISSSSLATLVNFNTGLFPQYITMGDFDGDGKPDIATANYLDSSISVLRNTAISGSITSGSFATNVNFATGQYPAFLAAGDIDGDGKSDIIDLADVNSLEVLRNDPLLPSSVSPITGILSVCIGSTTSLSDATPGGTWSSSNTAVGTVGSSTGVVSGISAGTTTISYTTGAGTATAVVTVSPLPNAGTITGIASFCAGSSTTLSDGVTGGVWSATGVVTVVPTGATALIASNSAGTATISYTVTNSCGTAVATKVVTVSSASAGTITGSHTICVSSSTALTDAVAGGVWSSGATGVATVSTAGLVTGVSLGTATISYTTSGSCGGTATFIVTVNTSVTAGTITGTATLCSGGTTSLTDVVSGGAWTSSNTLVATAASSGVITGVATGTATIYYTVSNSCGTATATKIVTVNSAPGAGSITGTAVLCAGATTSLADPTGAPGGVWSSAVPSVATVGTSGIVTGVATGTSTISYTVTNSCGTNTATRVVTVNAATTAGTITGTTTLCTGTTTALTDAVTGGVWTSGSPAVATVGTGGIVTGVSAGTAVISYTITNSCGTVRATATVTVNGSSAGVITGPATVVTGMAISLTASLGGGTWSASNGNATVSGTGVVTGVTPGSVIISYTISSGCGSVSATKLITVSNATVPPISGYYFYLCAGATSLFWDATTGGSWGISPTSVATVSPTGVVAGISAGIATLSYTYGGTTVTATVTINAAPAAITGAPTVCSGTTTLLSDATPGGTWSSSAASVATISTAGLVTGSTTGTTTIYYTGTGGCKASMVLTVTSAPSGIGGATSVCAGASITMSDFTLGGTWSSSGTATVVATGPTTALVSGISPGAATITYSLGASCYRTFNLSVKAIPTPILGSLSVCGLGAVTFLSDVTSGISWTIAPTTVATVSPSGRVYGVSAGTANVTFTATNGCIATAMVTVNAAVAVSPITGPTNVSHLATITLSDVTPGGIWISSNPSLGSVNASGDVTGVGTSGTVTISYAVAYAGGNCNTIVTKPITVHTPGPPTHSTTTTVGATLSVADEQTAGDWMSSDNTIANVDENGIITAVAEGSAQITHISANSEGAIVTATTQLVVNAFPFEVRMVPNPNNGTFTIGGTIGSKRDEHISIEITDMLGQVVYRNSAMATGGLIDEQILLNSNFANGMYLLNVKSGNENKVLHFVIEK